MHRGRENLPRHRCPARMRVAPPAGRMPPELQQRSQQAERRHDPSALGVHAAAAASGAARRGCAFQPPRRRARGSNRRAPCATPPAVRSRECQRMPEWQKPAGGRMTPPYRYGEGVHAAGRHGAGRSSYLWASCQSRSPNRYSSAPTPGLSRLRCGGLSMLWCYLSHLLSPMPNPMRAQPSRARMSPIPPPPDEGSLQWTSSRGSPRC